MTIQQDQSRLQKKLDRVKARLAKHRVALDKATAAIQPLVKQEAYLEAHLNLIEEYVEAPKDVVDDTAIEEPPLPAALGGKKLKSHP